MYHITSYVCPIYSVWFDWSTVIVKEMLKQWKHNYVVQWNKAFLINFLA